MPANGKAKIFRPPPAPGVNGGHATTAGGLAGLSPGATGVLLALAAAFFWSTSGMFIKVLPIDPLPLAGLRCAMAGVLLLPLLRPAQLVRPRLDRDFIILIVFYTAVSLSFVTATKWTAAANAIALQSTSPAWVFLVSCLLARRIFWRFSAPILIILAGLVIILLEPARGTNFMGNLLGLNSGLFSAGFIIFYARVQRPVIQLLVVMNLAAAALMFLVQPGAFRVWEIALSEWLMLAYLGGVQVGLAYICFYAALKRISTTQAAILSLLEPLLNPIWVYAAVGEIPTGYLFAGGGLVLSGIAVDTWLRRGQEARKMAPP